MGVQGHLGEAEIEHRGFVWPATQGSSHPALPPPPRVAGCVRPSHWHRTPLCLQHKRASAPPCSTHYTDTRAHISTQSLQPVRGHSDTSPPTTLGSLPHPTLTFSCQGGAKPSIGAWRVLQDLRCGAHCIHCIPSPSQDFNSLNSITVI